MTYRILLVDDNEIQLRLISRLLAMEGYQVTTALSGKEAIQAVINETPDIAVLDGMMPEMSGYDLCKILRQPPHSFQIPIVMLTAMVSQVEKNMAKDAGANDVWSKPFDVDFFNERIKFLVGDDKK